MLIAPGRYREDLDFRGRDVRVVGTGTPSNPVVLANSMVRFSGGETRAALLEGIRFERDFSLPAPSGIVCLAIEAASPTIRNCVVTNAGYFVGGLTVQVGSPRFEDCVVGPISGNPGGFGAAPSGGGLPELRDAPSGGSRTP